MNPGTAVRTALFAAAMAFSASCNSNNAHSDAGAEKTESAMKAEPQTPSTRPATAPRAPQFASPEISNDRRLTLRIYAPQAKSVRINTPDIPGASMPRNLTRDASGVWTLATSPLDAGAYRYLFTVDGVPTVDPKNGAGSESRESLWSLAYVPGAEAQDLKNVPHGALAIVRYRSKALGIDRRMHIYTPPGYEAGNETYPVFYLLHGAGDSDDAWPTVGRANMILDNLIAAKKAVPMIVVMPAGHTPNGVRAADGSADPFVADFTTDILPYVESHYRVKADKAHRAIAGLSMGGAHTVKIAFAHLDWFAYIGVFSMGGTENLQTWETRMKPVLDNAELKKGLKVLWYAIGEEDRSVNVVRNMVEMLKKHGFDAGLEVSKRGHVWLNWRDYLTELAPRLFAQ